MESITRSDVPRSAGGVCPTCRMEVAPKAQKCGHCGEWFVDTRLNAVDRVLTVLGWAWALLSVFGAIALWVAANSALGYGETPSIWDSLPFGVIAALLLQGLVIGIAVVSFAQRGARDAAT